MLLILSILPLNYELHQHLHVCMRACLFIRLYLYIIYPLQHSDVLLRVWLSFSLSPPVSGSRLFLVTSHFDPQAKVVLLVGPFLIIFHLNTSAQLATHHGNNMTQWSRAWEREVYAKTEGKARTVKGFIEQHHLIDRSFRPWTLPLWWTDGGDAVYVEALSCKCCSGPILNAKEFKLETLTQLFRAYADACCGLVCVRILTRCLSCSKMPWATTLRLGDQKGDEVKMGVQQRSHPRYKMRSWRISILAHRT